MNERTCKIQQTFFAALFFIASAIAAWLHEYGFLLIPFAFLALCFFVQYPLPLFYLLLFSIPWSVEYNFRPDLASDIPDEPLMLLTAFTVCMRAVYLRKQIRWRQLHPLLFIICLQFAWSLLTVLASTHVVLSGKYLLAKSWYLLAFVGAPLFFFRNETTLKRGAVLLMVSVLLFMLLTLVRHARYAWTFEKINDALEPFFGNHVNYSALLVFTVPLQVAALQLTASKKIRAILFLSLAVTLAALYLSYARGAWLALFLGTAAYWLIRKKLLLSAYLLTVFLCLATVLWLRNNDHYLKFSNNFRSTVFHKDFREHLIATYEMKDVSTAERFYRWVAGVRMAKDNWKTGFGPTTFYREYKSYTQPAFKTWVSRNKEQSTVHNYFLLLLIEQGVMGLLLFLTLLGVLFWYIQRVYHRSDGKFTKTALAAVAAILVMQCTVNFLSDLIETDEVGSVFYLCVAVVVILSNRTK